MMRGGHFIFNSTFIFRGSFICAIFISKPAPAQYVLLKSQGNQNWINKRIFLDKGETIFFIFLKLFDVIRDSFKSIFFQKNIMCFMTKWDNIRLLAVLSIPSHSPWYPHFTYFASVGDIERRSDIFIFRRFIFEERCLPEAAPAIPDRGRGPRGIREDIPDQGD